METQVTNPWQAAEAHIMTIQSIIRERNLIRLSSGALKSLAANRTLNVTVLHADYSKRVKTAGCPDMSVIPVEEFAQWVVAQTPVDTTAEPQWNPKLPTAESVEDLITNALSYYNIDLGPTGESIRRSGVDIQYDILEALVKEYCRDYEDDSKPKGAKEFKRKPYAPSRISDALKLFISNRDIHCREMLRQAIQYDPAAGDQFFAWNMLQTVLDIFQIKEDRELSTIMLMQWMWQTKRYALGMEVLEPIMLNFMGTTQGTMKTSFIEALTTPFKQYRVTNAKLKQVLDEREYTLWAKKYVIIFDELQKGRMARNEFGELITAMKSLLTAKSVGGRVMKTTHHIEMQRIFSPISSSNTSITSVIRDRTGMRRFFEMNVQTTVRADPRMIAIVNALLDVNGGYASLVWKSVNEHLRDGYMEMADYKERLYQVQDTYQIIDPTDLWLASDDIRDMPVKYSDMAEGAIKEHLDKLSACTRRTDVDALNDKIDPMVWKIDYALNKEASEWVKEEMGDNTVQYLGGREHFNQYFHSHGYVIATVGVETYILCRGVAIANAADGMKSGLGD